MERPIIFPTDMVKAIPEGRKTQTRRVIKKPENYDNIRQCDFCCPYGQVGDKLWIRETIAEWQGTVESVKNGDLDEAEALEYIVYKASAKDWAGILKDRDYGHPWNVRPSIFMPRWASRITLEITEIRVERLKEITWKDVLREGVGHSIAIEHPKWMVTDMFQHVWDSINGKKYPWSSNPFVWVISFKPLPPTGENK